MNIELRPCSRLCVFADHIVDAVNEMYSEIIHKAVTHGFICTEQLLPSVEEAYLDPNRWDSTSS